MMKKCFNTILRLEINEKNSGKTVEQILKKEFDISSGLLKELKLSGKIFINNKVCRSIDRAYLKDVVGADVREEKISEIPTNDEPLDILFEDDYVLMVNKPAGMSIHPSMGNYNRTLAGAVINHWRKKGEEHNFHGVNRLDKDTSGICIIAKNRYAHHILSNQQQTGEVKKRYCAIVHGEIKNAGIVDFPIKREKEGIIKREISPYGKPAVTKYYPIFLNKNFSLINLELLTGRTHQIRVHMAALGHPLFGDWLYGNGDNEKYLISRQALNVSQTEIFHPATKEKGEFFVELPEDMKNLVEILKKS